MPLPQLRHHRSHLMRTTVRPSQPTTPITQARPPSGSRLSDLNPSVIGAIEDFRMSSVAWSPGDVGFTPDQREFTDPLVGK
jgi:hypothetical protein